MRNLKHPMEIDANGELVVLTDLDALRQKTNQRLSLFKASWFLNKERGVPYIQDIIKKPVDPGLAASIIGSEILKESENLSLGEVSTDLDRETRVFTYTAKVNTIYGPMEITL